MVVVVDGARVVVVEAGRGSVFPAVVLGVGRAICDVVEAVGRPIVVDVAMVDVVAGAAVAVEVPGAESPGASVVRVVLDAFGSPPGAGQPANNPIAAQKVTIRTDPPHPDKPLMERRFDAGSPPTSAPEHPVPPVEFAPPCRPGPQSGVSQGCDQTGGPEPPGIGSLQVLLARRGPTVV